MLSFCSNHKLCRSFVLLAPSDVDRTRFADVEGDAARHRRLLESAQRLRANVYLEINALNRSQLTPDGLHCHPVDERAFHLLTLNEDDEVAACARYILYPNTVKYSDLTVSQTPLARTSDFGPILQSAVEDELASARSRNLNYAEVGGWAIAPDLRCTTEAVRIILSLYALSDRFGGALGIAAANRSRSAPILRRAGGEPVSQSGSRLPVYVDPHFHNETELIRFDSTRPSSKFQQMLERLKSYMIEIPVVCAN